MAQAEIAAAMAALGLTVESTFVPFSQSRHASPAKGEKPWLCLNWRVRLMRAGREIVATDYSAGSGHCPASKLPEGDSWSKRQKAGRIRAEIESGFPSKAQWMSGGSDPENWRAYPLDRKRPLTPEPESVVASLISDSSVLDYSSFESWAPDFGYDPDSRKGEAIYRACLAIALALRNGLGEDGLATLREACADY